MPSRLICWSGLAYWNPHSGADYLAVALHNAALPGLV